MGSWKDEIQKLQQIIDTHNRIVFFGGAGVSTESGIPDFRSQDGLYNQQYRYPPETKAAGKLTAVVTQNIDGLHQKAGSKNVYELHGSIHRNYCMKCGKFFDAQYIKAAPGTPRCDACGGLVKPDVVLYEEGLDSAVINGAVNAIREADCLIIGGTSLVVYPAAGLIDYFGGDKLVLINKSPTSRDRMADLVIRLSPAAAGHLAPGGLYITSGILDIKEDLVSDAIKAAGFRIEQVLHDGEWCAVVAGKV